MDFSNSLAQPATLTQFQAVHNAISHLRPILSTVQWHATQNGIAWYYDAGIRACSDVLVH